MDLYHSVRAAIGRHALVMAHFSHAYADGCSIYFTFAGHRARCAEPPSACTTRSGAMASRRRRASAARSATTTASACSRRRTWRASTARRWRSSRPRSSALDPDGMFNPGKMGLRARGLAMSAVHASSSTAVGTEHVEELDAGNWRVTPGSAAEVAEVIRRAGAHQAAVHPVGAGGRPQRMAGTRARVHLDAPPRSGAPARRDLAARPRAGRPHRARARAHPRAAQPLDRRLPAGRADVVARRHPRGAHARQVERAARLLRGRRRRRLRRARRWPHRPHARRAAPLDRPRPGARAVRQRGHDRLHHLRRAADPPEAGGAARRRVRACRRSMPRSTRSTSRCARRPRRPACGSTTPPRPRCTTPVSRSRPGHALLCGGTAGPTDLAACDRDLITSAVLAEGGHATDLALAELWWRRLHAGEPTPGPAPTLQVMATPSKLRAVYHAVGDEARWRAPTSRGSMPTAP